MMCLPPSGDGSLVGSAGIERHLGCAAVTRGGLGFWRWLAALAFAYILFRPVSSNAILVPVLGLIGALAAGTIIWQRRALARPLFFPFALTLLFAPIWLAVGSDNPGFLNAALVYGAAPLLFWLCAIAVDQQTLKLLLGTAAVATVAVGTVIALYVAGDLGLVPQVLPSWLLEETGAGLGELDTGATAIRFYGLSTLVAAGPMWVASLLVHGDGLLPGHRLRLAAAVAGTVGAFLGGRRALVIVLLAAPLLAWLIKVIVTRGGRAEKRKPPAGLVIGGVFGLAAVAPFLPSLIASPAVASAWRSVSDYFLAARYGAPTEQLTRAVQGEKLLAEWSRSPLWGNGLGHVIPNFARSERQPWQFELQYHALLMQVGLLGVLVVIAGALGTAKAIIKAAKRRPDLAPTLTATSTAAVAMLIANASNPYLQAPGHVWALFLPIAVANVILLDAPRSLLAAPRWAARSATTV